MSTRRRPETMWDWIERGWRPFVAWVCIILVFVPLCVCTAVIMGAFTLGFITSISTGQPMPDLTAGLDRVLPSIMPYIGPGLAGLLTLLLSRHREVNTELGGAHNARPFDPSLAPPSASVSAPASLPAGPLTPDGGLVNNSVLGGGS
jgi:hypothetical protein